MPEMVTNFEIKDTRINSNTPEINHLPEKSRGGVVLAKIFLKFILGWGGKQSGSVSLNRK